MTHGALVSCVFGLGIFIQAWLLLGKDISRKDIKELMKDIGAAFFFMLLTIPMLGISIYVFYFGFCLGFALSFRDRILTRVNEFSVLALNAIMLYYFLAYLGLDNFFTQMFSALILLDVALFLKKDLGKWRKSFVYYWFMFLYLIIAFKNLFAIWPEANISLVEYLIIGGLYLNIWAYIGLLVISLADPEDLLVKKYNFLYLSRFVEPSGSNPLFGLAFFLSCMGILLLNLKNHFVSENSLVVIVLLLISIFQRRTTMSASQVPVQANNLANQGVQN